MFYSDFYLLQNFEYIWERVDADGDGKLDYGEFVRGFLGEMNEGRKSVVRKVNLIKL